jgi:LacI family transcriptional regulator
MERRSSGAPERPTLALVARAAGVSLATASKVLNNRPDVAPGTRRRVTTVLRELGYEPTTAPRAIHHDRVVVVVFDTLVNLYSTQVLRGVLAAAKALGVDIVVKVLAEGDPGPEAPLSKAWVQAVAARGWKGLLAVTTAISDEQYANLRAECLPIVAIDPPNALDDSLVSVGSTNFIGGMQATNHLIDLGHRRIGVAGGPKDLPIARERLHGYQNALDAADIPYDVTLVRRGAFTYESGVEMCLDLLDSAQPPTAIVAGCDLSALGVLEGARRLGVRIPQELSVVGFDDTPAAEFSAPRLTTVRQPMAGLGRVALESLLLQAAGAEPASHHLQLATTLIVRESTRALKQS